MTDRIQALAGGVVSWARTCRLTEQELDAQLVLLRAEVAGLESEWAWLEKQGRIRF